MASSSVTEGQPECSECVGHHLRVMPGDLAPPKEQAEALV